MTRTLVALTLMVAFLCGSAVADVVHLTNGKSIEGTVVTQGDKVKVRTQYGFVVLKKSEIARIEKGSSLEAEWTARRSAIKDKDIPARFRLALWAKDKGWTKKAREEFEAILKLDPNHRGAHYTLGHVRYDGKWMTEDQAMKAQGYVKLDGRWVTAEEKVLLEVDASYRKRVMAIQAKVTAFVKAMASPSKAVRKKYHRNLVTLARKLESPELEKKANEVAAWYDQAYQALAARGLIEVRAQMATLKRPIPTFSTSLGAGTTPVTLHLPEVALVSIGTTVSVPFGR